MQKNGCHVPSSVKFASGPMEWISSILFIPESQRPYTHWQIYMGNSSTKKCLVPLVSIYSSRKVANSSGVICGVMYYASHTEYALYCT